MNEEEKKAVFYLKDLENDKEHLVIEQRQAITTILNLIEKQQKEIEKLKSKKYVFNAKTQEVKEIPIDDNYISKDKIEAKIEKIKEDEKFYRERDRMYEFNGKINILKELVGE